MSLTKVVKNVNNPLFNNSEYPSHMSLSLQNSFVVDCCHRMTYNGLCVNCGSDVSCSTQSRHVNLDFISPGLRAKEDYVISELVKMDYEYLMSQKKLRLVLDLDETLLHSEKVDQQDEDSMDIEERDFWIENGVFHFLVGKTEFCVYFRPGVFEFLNDITKNFEVYIYTNGTQNYANKVLQILNHLMTQRRMRWGISGILARKGSYRPLKKLHNMLCKRSCSIIVDDSPDVWCPEDGENILRVSPFYGNPNDDELFYLGAYLDMIHKKFFSVSNVKNADVRDILYSMSD